MSKLYRKLGPVALVAVVGGLLAACASSTGVTSIGVAECKQISKKAEAKINWARVPQIDLRIRNDEFSPMVMRLRQGRPYILRIRNRDEAMHVFRAPDFFRQNAIIAIGVEGVRAEEACAYSVTIPGRQTAEIRMVAVTDGTFEYEDNMVLVPFVVSSGASGAIIIEERRETAGL